jgi:radical SAM protein with 4Fe4S-binding SPASM domain
MINQDSLLLKKKASLEEHNDHQFNVYGDRYSEYRKKYHDAGNFHYEPDFPLYVMLEQSYKCNLSCKSCIHGYEGERDKYSTGVGTMSWDLFEKIILECEDNNCPSVSMHSNDEPLLIKDLEKRIKFAKSHNIMEVIMTTNGFLMSNERALSIINSGVTHILFSVDAATEKTYNTVRPGGDFNKILAALNFIKSHKKETGNIMPYVRVSFVQTEKNKLETKLFVKKFEALVDSIEIQGFSSYYNFTNSLIPIAANRIEAFQCSEPWRKLIVRPNGDVLPCCSFYGYDIVVGNVFNEKLKTIFNSEKMKLMRSNHKKGIYNIDACKKCSSSIYAPID